MPAEVGATGTVPSDFLNATITTGPQMDRDAEMGRAPLQVTINGLNEKAILDWWKNYKLNPKFNIFGRNCATTVRTALEAGGAHTQDQFFPTTYDVYLDAENIRDLGPDGPIIAILIAAQAMK